MTSTPATDRAATEADLQRAPDRGPYSKGIQRRQEIVDAAIEVFTERGMEGFSFRAIGEAIGVSHAGLRNYFPSREALLIEVLRQREARQVAAEDPSAAVFDTFGDAVLRNLRSPGIVALHTTMLAAAIEKDDREAREFFTERFREARAELAAKLQDEFGSSVSKDDAQKIAALVLAASDGMQVQWLLEPTLDIAEILSMLRRLVS